MKKLSGILYSLVLSTLFVSCLANKPFSQADSDLLDRLQFEKAEMAPLQVYKKSEFSRLATTIFSYDEKAKTFTEEKTDKDGIVFEVGKGKSGPIVEKFRKRLKGKGYLIFASEDNFSMKNDKVAVLRATDQFEILMTMQTDGANYDLDNAMIIEKLKAWNENAPFEIVGAGLDWLEARFVERPRDMLAFAQEVYAFCPDVVDQGTQTVEALASEMKKTNTLYLWWD
jgi:hypothetical protein